jgi:hypothetical protein
MRFLLPSLFFAWAALVLVPIVFYLFRPRPRTIRTSTLPFFIWLAREHQDSAWLRRLKYLISLLLCVLTILLAAAALGRLVVAPEAGSLKSIVLLVDRSVSMTAVDGYGRSRLDEAKSYLRRRLAGIPAGVELSVVAYDKRPEVLLSRGFEMRTVDRALNAITARPINSDSEEAMHLAAQLAALKTPSAIWHVTDQPDVSPEKSKAGINAKGISIEQFSMALEKPVNVGITAVQLRRQPLERIKFEAFVQLHCSAPASIKAELEVRLDGNLVAIRAVTLAPGGRETLLIPVDADAKADRVLTLAITAKGDKLPADNIVAIRVPHRRPIKVLWISDSPDPFTELALSSIAADEDLQVLQASPGVWPPKDPANVVIFDGWLPKEWPKESAIIVLNPPGSLGPVRAVRLGGGGLPLESIRAPEREHPLLYGVATERVALTQTAVLQAGGPLEPLWTGSHGPLLLAGESGGRRVVVMAFSPEHSQQLPLMASYPLLVGNALYWSSEDELDAARGMNRKTGDVVQLQGKKIIWREVEGEQWRTKAVELASHTVELDRIGLWETDAGETGSAALLSPEETVLPAAQTKPTAEGQTAGQAAGRKLFRGDLAPMLLWSLFGLLIVESWMFHRYWVY